MANITDAELTILKNTLEMVREALKEDESSLAVQIKKLVVESEQIVSGKMGEGAEAAGGTPAGTLGTLTGASASAVSNTNKTKSLFEMFHLDGRLLQR